MAMPREDEVMCVCTDPPGPPTATGWTQEATGDLAGGEVTLPRAKPGHLPHLSAEWSV